MGSRGATLVVTLLQFVQSYDLLSDLSQKLLLVVDFGLQISEATTWICNFWPSEKYVIFVINDATALLFDDAHG